MDTKIDEMQWDEMWRVVHYYVCIHFYLPEKFPVPNQFWAWKVSQREQNRNRLLPGVVELGPDPKFVELERLLGYGSGDTVQWIKRRFKSIFYSGMKNGEKPGFDRDAAVEEFFKRKKENAGKERVNNGGLCAGSPVYYYCEHCGAEDIKSETFDPRLYPIKDPCDKCKELIENGGVPE